MLTTTVSVKEQALEKMLAEMNKKHTGAEDAIHNWLCDQDDDLLFEGIMKKDKTINGALKYCATNASKQKSGNVAMIDDQTVFGWVYKYFTDKKATKVNTKIQAEVRVSQTPKRKKRKSEVNNTEGAEQLSLLDF